MFFDRMANGKSEIVISEISNPQFQGMLNRIAQSVGATNGRLTRDQYIQGSQQMMAQWQRGGGFQRPNGGGPPTAGPANTGGTAEGQTDQMAEAEFKRRDRNNDGLLNQDEMGRELRAEWQQWDTNKDGAISLAEFKAFYASKMQQRQNQYGNAAIVVTAAAEEEDKKPTVYRAGKLPDGIPSWFSQLDTDSDGQIGLYEWKASGRPIEDFLAMDRNKDGFLTIDEVMRAEKAKPSRGGPAAGRGGQFRIRGGNGPTLQFQVQRGGQ
jgi:Ca2+-binding EF-hand superfamily protein